MSIFGWSYPPGAANDPNAPYNQCDPPCDVCGQELDHCVCPECPVCETIGDPSCYDDPILRVNGSRTHNHRQKLNDAQKAARADAEEQDRLQAEAEEAEARYWETHPQEEM